MRPIAKMFVLAVCLLSGVAAAQRSRPVSTDESVIAADALIRVRELSEAGNTGEALRVVQSLLENESDRLLPSAEDRDLFVPVRAVVHELLLANADLLARYREKEGPRSEEMLAAGALGDLERTRLLTKAGFEAALRLAQLDMESARFEAARRMLEQLERHPDRRADRRCGQDAAVLAASVASFLARDEARAWAGRWAAEAGMATPPAVRPVTPPAAALVRSRDGLAPGPGIDVSAVPQSPLQSVVADPRDEEASDPRAGRPAWVSPSLVDGMLYLNDGERVWARDAATLSLAWASEPLGGFRTANVTDTMFALVGPQGFSEDLATVSVGSGVAVAALGIPESGVRRGDRRLHAFDAVTGRRLWAVDPSDLDPRLEETYIRGPALIDADTVVVAVRKASAIRRTSAMFLVGLDLFSGRMRWTKLVGSVGTNPWGRAMVRPDGGVVHRGVVYRGDDMGVVGAYEAATGRPKWLRVTRAPRGIDFNSMRSAAGIPAFEMQTPLVVGDSLYFIEPGRERVLRLDPDTGALRGSRDASALGDPRYLLSIGDLVAAVSPTRVAVVRASEFEHGTIRLSQHFGGEIVRGRAVVAGDRILVPVDTGVISLLPEDPATDVRRELPTSGNLLVASPESGEAATHLLVTDTQRLHSYVGWEQAERLLERRVAQSPRDPTPVLTYVELLHRSGHTDRVPKVADGALRLLDASPQSEASRRGRAKLFELLLEMVRGAHLAWVSPPGASTALTAPAVKDPAIIDALLARLSRSAEGAPEQAATALETAWLRETQNQPDRAVEAYQQVLLDADLAAAVPAGASEGPAGETATARLALLLRRVGPGPYEAFNDEAQHAAADIPAGAGAEQLAALARRYPAAGSTADLWRRAAEAYQRAGRPVDARKAAGAGLASAELSAAIGRPDTSGAIGRLAGVLLSMASGPTDAGALYRTLARLAREHPGLIITGPAGSTPVETATRAAAGALRARAPLPRLGRTLEPVGQTIEGWEPVEPLVKRVAGVSTDSAVMVSELRQEMGLWALSAEDGQLRLVWSRAYRAAPTPVHVGHDRTILFWPTGHGGYLEAIGLDGATEWKTPEFLTLFPPPAEADPNDRIPTPLDGQVRPDALVMSMDDATITLVQRSGPAAAFDLSNGKPLWQKPLDAARVYDTAQTAGTLVVIGARRTPEGALAPAVIALDARTGAEKSRMPASVTGDHPRWIRTLPGGDAVVAVSDGLVRYTPSTGNVLWTAKVEALRASTDGWIVGSSVFVLDSELRLRRVELEGGALAERAMDSRDKLTLPVSAAVSGTRLTLSTSQGVLVYEQNGSLVGTDSLDSSNLESAAEAESVLVTVESPQREYGIADSQTAPYRLILLEQGTAKLAAAERVKLFEPPRVIMVLDGKVLLGQGVATFVFDAPPER